MKLILAGQSPYSEEIARLLRAAGAEIALAPTPEALRPLPASLPVLLLTRAETAPFLTDDAYALTLSNKLPPLMPVLLLLDRESEASEHLTKLALSRAVFLAARRRRVIFLARSVRTAAPGAESLYEAARRAGVLFVKYEGISVSETEGGHRVLVSAGGVSQDFETKLLVDCSERPDPALAGFVKALRLRAPEDGRVSGGVWYLSPDLTLRRDVFCLDPVLAGERLPAALAGIARAISQLPNAGETAPAAVDAQKCAFCYTCYRACPHGAPEPDEAAPAMKISPVRCVGCGICAAICPANAITLTPANTADVKPEPKDTPARLLVLCCENSAALAARETLGELDARVESVPCGGYLGAERLAGALSSHDRVLVAVCVREACRHLEGNRRAHLQEEHVRELLERLGLPTSRVGYVEVSHAMPGVLRAAAERMLRAGEEVMS